MPPARTRVGRSRASQHRAQPRCGAQLLRESVPRHSHRDVAGEDSTGTAARRSLRTVHHGRWAVSSGPCGPPRAAGGDQRVLARGDLELRRAAQRAAHDHREPRRRRGARATPLPGFGVTARTDAPRAVRARGRDARRAGHQGNPGKEAAHRSFPRPTNGARGAGGAFPRRSIHTRARVCSSPRYEAPPAPPAPLESVQRRARKGDAPLARG